MSIPLKHHHLPIFYLKRWAREDGRICQFSRPHDELRAKYVFPSQTAYVERLYETKGLPPEQAQQVEEKFLQPLDTLAAEALAMLENDDNRLRRESKARSAWSRFVMSLIMRTPADIEALKRGVIAAWERELPRIEKKYAAMRSTSDPPNFKSFLEQTAPGSWEQLAMELAPRLMDHPGIGNRLNNMR